MFKPGVAVRDCNGEDDFNFKYMVRENLFGSKESVTQSQIVLYCYSFGAL